MNIAIIGAGNIGMVLARQLDKAGHHVTLAFSRDQQKLQQKAAQIGPNVQASSAAEAVRTSEVIILSCLWANIDAVLSEAGDLSGKIVIDATNQYDAQGLVSLPETVAAYNQARMPGAQLVRTFNMFTADSLGAVGAGEHDSVAMLYAAESADARATAEEIIAATGFTPVYIGGWDVVSFIEIPTGPALGKAYSPEAAGKIAEALLSHDIAKATDLANAPQ